MYLDAFSCVHFPVFLIVSTIPVVDPPPKSTVKIPRSGKSPNLGADKSHGSPLLKISSTVFAPLVSWAFNLRSKMVGLMLATDELILSSPKRYVPLVP